MQNRSEFVENLKSIAQKFGMVLLLISIYFSYDGLDQTVGNRALSWLALVIGLILATACTLAQLIFSTDYAKLNMTLKVVGLGSYVYSIYTNYIGIKHILQTDDTTAIVIAVVLDVIPEPMISWSMDEALEGDFIGNLLKWLVSPRVRSYTNKPQQQQPNYREPSQHNPNYDFLREKQKQQENKPNQQQQQKKNRHDIFRW